jgi:hypothetical protein
MDFAQHVGLGWGSDWRGILFRQTYPQLADVIAKTRKWIPRIFPRARFNEQSTTWKWPDGEELLLRHMKVSSDYNKYHGHEYPWIGWEELTTWPSGDCYHVMKSTNRSSREGIPRKYRATCNPYGSGHNWVKAHFVDPSPAGVPFVAERSNIVAIAAEFGLEVEASDNLQTVTIHGHYSENRTLMKAQADYPAVIAASASNPEQAKAWLNDDWDVVAGGMFDDVWNRKRHVLPTFTVPKSWRIDRSYDWGSTRPFSVGWWAEANGESVLIPDNNGGTRRFCPPRGSLVRIAEWYGWDGKTPNVGLKLTDTTIGKGIVERERQLGIFGRVTPGPADSSIFSADPGHTSPADAMAKEGAVFIEADKSPGSRKRGWEAGRRMLEESAKERPEGPGVWIMDRCLQFIRTVPTLPRDDKDPDDVDTDSEDHTADEWRYRMLAKKVGAWGSSTFKA